MRFSGNHRSVVTLFVSKLALCERVTTLRTLPDFGRFINYSPLCEPIRHQRPSASAAFRAERIVDTLNHTPLNIIEVYILRKNMFFIAFVEINFFITP